MRAVAVEEFGGPPRLIDLPRPEPGPHEVLVRLVAASPNPFDRAIHEGFLRDLPHVFPLVLGTDGSGVVEQVGDRVDRYAVGDAVYGVFAHEPLGKGTLAEYVSAPQDVLIAGAPGRIPLRQVAAAPTAGMTAVGVVDAARLGPDDTVLVVGATGGVGSFAVQLAAARGARVLATARPDAVEAVSVLGAAGAIEYADGGLAERVVSAAPDGVDVLIDTVSDPSGFRAGEELVRDGGRAISVRYAAGPDALESGRIEVANFNLRKHPDARGLLARLTAELEGGLLSIVIDAEVPLERAVDLLAVRAQGGARGKALIAIDDSVSPG